MIQRGARWVWRFGKRGLPVWEYAPIFREAADALLPIIELDFGFDSADYDNMSDEQATEEFMTRMKDAGTRMERLNNAVTKLTEIRPKDRELLDLHLNFIATARGNVIVTELFVSMMMHSGNNEHEKVIQAKKEI